MKKIKFLTLIASILVLSSCFEEPGTEVKWEGGTFVELDAATTPTGARSFSYLRTNAGTTYDAGFKVLLAAAKNTSGVTVNFTIGSNSTAIEGVHYTVSGSSVTIPAGEFVANLPFTILADNINAGESFSIYVTISDASVDIGDRSTARHNISISCPTDLAGTFSWVTTNYGEEGGPAETPDLTGTGTLTALATAGQYGVPDLSFGTWVKWGYGAVTGGRINDVCARISVTGSYSWAISGLTINPGRTAITFNWVNSFGDYGTTTLTRTDAKLWPVGANSL